MANKRVKSKEFLSDTDSDSGDGGDTAKKVKAKKPKTTERGVAQNDTESSAVWELGKMKKITISEFRGSKYVNIREYYMDKTSGEERPGKKGIALNQTQWEEFMKIAEEVNTVFTTK